MPWFYSTAHNEAGFSELGAACKPQLLAGSCCTEIA